MRNGSSSSISSGTIRLSWSPIPMSSSLRSSNEYIKLLLPAPFILCGCCTLDATPVFWLLYLLCS